MNYNTDFLQNNKNSIPINNEDINNQDINNQDINNNTNDLMGYDNLYSNFDNYGNNRDIALVDNNIINNFQNRFIQNPINKLQHDIDLNRFKCFK